MPDLPELLRQATQSDWRTRALALSELAPFAREDSAARWLIGIVVRRIPGWHDRFPYAGSRGRHLRNRISDGLFDRSWPVRVAAALTLGECRASSRIKQLKRLLRAPLRAERIAAAAAIVHCGGRLDVSGTALLADALPAPASIGDTTRSIEFLAMLAARHQAVLSAWMQIPGEERPDGSTPADWASFLAGPVPAETYSGTDAEIQRYAGDAETEYLLTKPFSHINRTQNVRLLHSFLVAAEHLRVAPGGKILDLGGGSGWVSELLTQFGYRPFTLDLSSALLGIGQRRFAKAGLIPRFMVGDMTTLPVASGSMDAVLVMDALHHVPDVPAVFREAFRVLAEGGQFVLAEPGEGHSETEKARAEMAEHGVEEREIHLFDMIDYGRAAGFDQIRVAPHYVPGIGMSAEQVRAATSAPAGDWMMYQDDRLGHFPDYVMQSMFTRPVLVFRKGSRPVDSRMPQRLKAEIAATLTRDASRVKGTVSVRNAGDTIWLGADNRVGYVQLGLRLLDADRHPVDLEFGRVMLAGHVVPGKKVDLSIDVTLPDTAAPYVLKIDMVDEGICWFEDVESAPVYVRL
jgi:ubiquinone/menaquinone biosynthesis C-methylase UbiE